MIQDVNSAFSPDQSVFKWLDQLRNDSTRPTGDLWRRAVDRGHGCAITRRPSLATRTWWWWWWIGIQLLLNCYTVVPPIRRHPPSSGIRIVLLYIKGGTRHVSQSSICVVVRWQREQIKPVRACVRACAGSPGRDRALAEMTSGAWTLTRRRTCSLPPPSPSHRPHSATSEKFLAGDRACHCACAHAHVFMHMQTGCYQAVYIADDIAGTRLCNSELLRYWRPSEKMSATNSLLKAEHRKVKYCRS